ncbi:MAG: hypothetical protein ThorAB25_21830 [Candidatus Thorarchaeota archaeon AB_25]|nr:MAG: hypothetical protein ThorAB25_21830 [Candidatus Thorarchaeota archaeon AB_25]
MVFYFLLQSVMERELSLLKALIGWEQIRQALLFVESLCVFSKQTLAGVEIFQQSEYSTTRVFLKTLEELDDYLRPIFEQMILDSRIGHIHKSDGLDLLSDVYGRIVLDYPYGVSKSREMMP